MYTHSRVTVGGWSMEYEHKLLCQFTTTVGGTRCYLWLSLNRVRATHRRATQSVFLGIQPSGSSWKAPGYSKKTVHSTFKNKLQWTGKNFFLKLLVWPCSNVVQIDRMLVYCILCATAWASWRRKLYSNFIEQPPTVAQLRTVANLLLWWTITGCLP